MLKNAHADGSSIVQHLDDFAKKASKRFRRPIGNLGGAAENEMR